MTKGEESCVSEDDIPADREHGVVSEEVEYRHPDRGVNSKGQDDPCHADASCHQPLVPVHGRLVLLFLSEESPRPEQKKKRHKNESDGVFIG